MWVWEVSNKCKRSISIIGDTVSNYTLLDLPSVKLVYTRQVRPKHLHCPTARGRDRHCWSAHHRQQSDPPANTTLQHTTSQAAGSPDFWQKGRLGQGFLNISGAKACRAFQVCSLHPIDIVNLTTCRGSRVKSWQVAWNQKVFKASGCIAWAASGAKATNQKNKQTKYFKNQTFLYYCLSS